METEGVSSHLLSNLSLGIIAFDNVAAASYKKLRLSKTLLKLKVSWILCLFLLYSFRSSSL